MSGITYDPPIEDVPIFDASLFVVDNVGLTTAQADLRYLKFPNAQGTENLSAFTASGTATLNGPVNVNGNAITARDTAVAPTSTITLNPAPNSAFVTLTNTTDTLSIFTSQATLSSDIQVQSTKKLNIATTTTNVDLNIGTGARTVSGVVHNYSDGDNAVAGSGVHLNNGVNNFSATNIHNGTSSSGSVNIMSGTGSGGNINIGSGNNSNPTITIGNEVTLNSTNNLYGNTTITKPFMDVISATTVSSTPSLFNNTTTGNIQIAQNQTSGTFSIGGGLNRSSSISIGQSTKGNILIGSSQQAGTNLTTVGTASLGTLSLRGGIVRLNDSGSGTVDIGNPSGGAITILRPLTPNYNSVYSTTGTGTGKIGEYIKPVSGYGVSLLANAPKTLNQFTLGPGVWLCTGNATTGGSGAGYNALSFSFATNSLNLSLGAMNIPAFAGFTYNVCCTYTFSLTASTIIYLVGQVAIDQTWGDPVLTATRLA